MKLSDLLRLAEKETGAVFCMEPKHPVFFTEEDLKLLPDQYVHHGPYCVWVKSVGGLGICAANKKQSLKLGEKGRSWSGVCPHGLMEYAAPVRFDGQLAALVYAGHLDSGREPAEINGKRYTGPKPPAVGPAERRKIRDRLRLVALAVEMELRLWREHGGRVGKRRDEAYYWEQTSFYIAGHYAENVSLGELAAELKVSANYLGGIIRKKCGRTFRELLNEKRVSEAQTYLRYHRWLNITEIAAMCGFEDSNYFSTVYRRVTGLRPRDERNKKAEAKE